MTPLNPKALGAKCSWCPFSKHGSPVRPVFGEGPKDALGLIFAESPGEEEVSRGRLLVGATGKEFDNSLINNRLQRSRLFLINVIACKPNVPKTESVMMRATECCRPLVLAQIRHLPPDLPTLALGKWAWFSITGVKKALKKARGFLRPWHRRDMEHANELAMVKLNKEMIKHVKHEERKNGAAPPAQPEGSGEAGPR